MMNARLRPMGELTDEQLWGLTVQGDREAFGRIVERYQGLVSALAYSTCGDLSRSQDLAQETFVAAWRQRAALQEPGKLRGWLCGIARNLTANWIRRERRRTTPGAAPLESATEVPSPKADPVAEVINREEATLLWRALEDLPTTYREPLVLFYREQQSVAVVAQQLGLSEDAAKQRLSRGRSLLRDEMMSLVEGALARTRPGPLFTAAVLGAIAASAPPTAAAGIALSAATGKGTATAGTALSAVSFGAILGPLLGLLGGYLGLKTTEWFARSERERAYLRRINLRILAGAVLWSVCLLVSLRFGATWYGHNPLRIVAVVLASIFVLALPIAISAYHIPRSVRQIRAETGTGDVDYAAALRRRGLSVEPRPLRYESRWRLLGLPLFCLAIGGPRVHGRYRRGMARGWIAVGDIAIAPLLAVGGMAAGGIAVGGLAVGGVAVAGLAAGGIALGGMGLGGLALGGLAAGVWAVGGAALGWTAAFGGVAKAGDYAQGGVALAAHANDAVANQWFASHPFFQGAQDLMGYSHWLLLLTLLPFAMHWWQFRRRP